MILSNLIRKFNQISMQTFERENKIINLKIIFL